MSLSKPAGEAEALRIARNYLSRRVHSRKELELYLRRRGLSGNTITRVAEACEASGLVDDAVCAKLWAEHWARSGFSWRIIAQRLKAKGLNARTIASASEKTSLAREDKARARLMAERLLARRPTGMTREQLSRRLSARGYDSDTIESLLDELFQGRPSIEEEFPTQTDA